MTPKEQLDAECTKMAAQILIDYTKGPLTSHSALRDAYACGFYAGSAAYMEAQEEIRALKVSLESKSMFCDQFQKESRREIGWFREENSLFRAALTDIKNNAGSENGCSAGCGHKAAVALGEI